MSTAQPTTENTKRKAPALLLLPVAIALASAAPVGAITPGINPNADSPSTGEVDTGLDIEGLGGSTGTIDLGGDPFESVVGEIDAGIGDIDGGIGTIDGGIGEVDGGIGTIGGGEIGGGLEEISGGVGTVIGGIDSITSAINGIFEAVAGVFNLERLLDLVSIELPDIFENPLGGLEGGGVEIAVGPLGLPDPKLVEESIENAQTTAFEEFAGARTGGEGSPVIKRDLATLFEREMVDEVAAQTALTEEGQQKLIENSDVAVQSLEASQELAMDSEEQDVSQNILRNISSQMAMAQQTSTLDTVDRQLQRRDSALRNLMLVNAVQELQADRIQDRRQNAAAYSDVITQGGQLILPGVGINPAGRGG